MINNDDVDDDDEDDDREKFSLIAKHLQILK